MIQEGTEWKESGFLSFFQLIVTKRIKNRILILNGVWRFLWFMFLQGLEGLKEYPTKIMLLAYFAFFHFS